MHCATSLRTLQRLERSIEADIMSKDTFRICVEEPDYETFKPSKQVLTRAGNCIYATQVDPQVKCSVSHPNGREFRVVERTEKEEKKLALEIWFGGQLELRQWVGKAFGKEVYTGGVFGSPRWASDESKVIFIAEKKKAEFNSYWSQEQSEEKDQPGKKFARGFGPAGNSFGETLVTKTEPIMCVYNLKTDLIETVPQEVFGEDVFPCHPTIAPDGSIVCSAFNLKQTGRVGLSACLNRDTKIFHLKDTQGPAVCLTPDYFFAMVPRFSPDGKSLAFYSHKEPFIVHSTAFFLVKIEWPVTDAVVTTLAENLFGYHDDMAKCDFVNNTTIAVQTSSRNAFEVALVTIGESATLLRPPPGPGSTKLLATGDDTLIVSHSSFKAMTSLWSYTVSDKTWKEERLRPSGEGIVQNSSDIMNNLWSSEIHDVELENGASAMLFMQKTDAPTPLVLKIHGGPHGHAVNAFSVELALHLSMGFAILVPNYRGSTGSTKSFCDDLAGQIGSDDVEDCEQLTFVALETFKSQLNGQVIAYGGSHGGFLTAWILGRNVIPLVGGVLWNPVTNLVSMLGSTDIPEWVMAEALQKGKREELSHDEILKLWDKSPISVAHMVRVPVMMVLGGDDRRVPPNNGREYVQGLSGLDHSQKFLLEFADQGHSITGKESNCYALVNICEWIADRFASAGE